MKYKVPIVPAIPKTRYYVCFPLMYTLLLDNNRTIERVIAARNNKETRASVAVSFELVYPNNDYRHTHNRNNQNKKKQNKTKQTHD